MSVYVQASALTDRLIAVRIFIACFGLFVMLIAVAVTKHTVNCIISEMEKLKQEIDTYTPKSS